MSHKRHRPAIDIFEDDEDLPASDDTPLPNIVQRHTHLESGARGFSSNQIFYSMPASPQKNSRSTEPDTIQWNTEGDEPPDLIDDEDDEDDEDEVRSRLMDPDLPEHNKDERSKRIHKDPLDVWVPEIDDFVQEFLRLEGRGDMAHQAVCARCEGMMTPSYRCCDCQDIRLFCRTCIVEGHASLPFHRIKEWCGSHFTIVSLKHLGLRIQLGHSLGQRCANPAAAFNNDFVVIDVNAIHSVALNFCDCHLAQPRHIQLLRAQLFPASTGNPKTAATFRVLKNFQLLSFMSKVSAFEYYHTISRQTDNTGTVPPPGRYTQFLRMVREWRHIVLLKRSGRGHDVYGVAGTKEGECAVLCPACPQPGKNLPENWKRAAHNQRRVILYQIWLYSLFLGIDANFRLKRLNVSSNERDPGLNHGYAYVVEESKFKNYLNEFGEKIADELSTCNNHDAIKSASMRGGKGTAASGVGTIEYVNMDYFFFSSLRQNAPTHLVVSYDIACQWARNLQRRAQVYPVEHSQPFRACSSISYFVPKFHLPAHQPLCQADFSFNFCPFVGRTDGEAPERGWGAINAVANSTKEMGPGSRRDTLDDHFGDYNWRKVSSMAVTLLRKVEEAVPARMEHTAAFKEFSAALSERDTQAWGEIVEAWEADKTKPNPFRATLRAISADQVRLQFAKEEKADASRVAPEFIHNDISPSTLIVEALQLETQQFRLQKDKTALGPHSTSLQRAKILQRENSLRRKIEAWSEIQQLYMPGVAVLRGRADQEGGGELVQAADINLFLPSEVIGRISCDRRLQKYEWRLRVAQAHDILHDIRRNLLIRTQLYKSKDRHSQGQRYQTKSVTAIKSLQSRIDDGVTRYRQTRRALVDLAGVLLETGWQNTLRPLDDEDVRGIDMGRDEGDSEGRRVLSWIWMTEGVGNSAAEMQQALCLEWCKGRARAQRWQEECLLLGEEMRRVKAFFGWQTRHWTRLAENASTEGSRAYGFRQAAIRHSMLTNCEAVWKDTEEYLNSGTGPLANPKKRSPNDRE